MAKYNGLQSFKRIWLRLYPFFCLDLFLCNFWWGHFVNLWPCYSCLSWMWKKVLIHFSCESSTSPSLQAYHKWFPIDVFYRMLSDLHLLAIFFMFLTKCNTSNWWFMPGSFSVMYFAYLSMAVGCNLHRGDIFIFKHLQCFNKSILFHLIRIINFRNFNQGHSCDFDQFLCP